jgi:uncharacterized protein (TIGR04255 family)
MARLPNAPLQEVIFEVRWRLHPGKDNGQVQDAGYELASGRLSSLLERDFPYYRRIVPAELPDQMLLYRAIHQYWKGENQWPVLQLGPGIFTVNCTDQGYDWDTLFRPLIANALTWLLQAYREPLLFAFASLRYIDAVKTAEYGGLDSGWQGFIKDNFNVEYNNLFDTRGKQRRVHIDQTFDLDDGSELQVQMSSGTKNNEPAFVWQTAVLKKSSFTKEDLIQWADSSHNISHDLFVDMIKPHLYASFSGKDKNQI